MGRAKWFLGAATFAGFMVLAVQLGGCSWPLDRRIVSRSGAGNGDLSGPDLALKNLCDVDRIRARSDLLNRFEVEKFRQVAVKISKAVTSEDLDDLRRLEDAREHGQDFGSEIRKRRAELIQQIYTEAIARAGYKLGASESASVGSLRYTVEIDPLSSGNDRYVNIVTGHLLSDSARDPGQIGAVSEVVLGAYPDQSRYHVTLSRAYRFETRPDGALSPLYEAVNLSRFVEELLPRQCESVGTSLDEEEFNTVAGLPLADG